ncbi:MAG TPA: hypothetical protein VJN96_09125 [Vicinamibacterales bacterium]|nr:hypothetical protein [Vicinamibacterales bacterium]
MPRAWQKISLRGNSAYVTIPRPMMYALGLVPGDLVVITANADKSATLVRLDPDANASNKSPGIIPEQPSLVKA